MENFRSLTVKQLQSKCKEAGLSCTGKKNELIERLERNEEKCDTVGMTERIAQLEKTIADLRIQSSRFQPSHSSSPMHTFVTPEYSPERIGSVNVPSEDILPVSSVSFVGSRTPATPLTTVYSQ